MGPISTYIENRVEYAVVSTVAVMNISVIIAFLFTRVNCSIMVSFE